MDRSNLLLAAAAMCMLDAGLADAQMSQPPVQGDSVTTSATGAAVGVLGTQSNSYTWSGQSHFTGGFYFWAAPNTGSSIGTVTTNNAFLQDESTAATAVWNVSNVAKKSACYTNDYSSAKTLTSSTGSFVVAGVSSLTETIAAGGHLCATGDGTNWPAAW